MEPASWPTASGPGTRAAAAAAASAGAGAGAEGTVRAAGGIVLRPVPGAPAQVVVVHRAAREDWSFPKGKLEPGESFATAARREVLEETGLRCALGPFAGHARYRDRKGRPKVVAYWVMHPESGDLHPDEEVDEVRWVALRTARDLLSYQRDRELLVVASVLARVQDPAVASSWI